MTAPAPTRADACAPRVRSPSFASRTRAFALARANDPRLTFERSTHEEDVCAAAACRALAFASSIDDADRSAYARRARVSFKTDSERESLTRKLRLRGEATPEVGYESVRVALVVARAALEGGTMPSGYDVRELDPRCLSAREDGMSLVVGSLDVNVGERLPAEELAGTESPGKRAYLSNVSVLPPARRRGIALALIERAMEVARDDFDVETVYIHAEKRNEAANACYAKAGFEMERTEPESVSVTHGRPPRVLFRRRTGLKSVG